MCKKANVCKTIDYSRSCIGMLLCCYCMCSDCSWINETWFIGQLCKYASGRITWLAWTLSLLVVQFMHRKMLTHDEVGFLSYPASALLWPTSSAPTLERLKMRQVSRPISSKYILDNLLQREKTYARYCGTDLVDTSLLDDEEFTILERHWFNLCLSGQDLVYLDVHKLWTKPTLSDKRRWPTLSDERRQRKRRWTGDARWIWRFMKALAWEEKFLKGSSSLGVKRSSLVTKLG